jgi:anti-sigma factor RsiW
MTDKAEQLERLLSEHLDGNLESAVLAELQQALAEDPAAAATARRYALLSDLLASWRALPGNIDWKAHARKLAGQTSSSDVDPAPASADRPAVDTKIEVALTDSRSRPGTKDQEYEAVDRLIQDRTGPVPQVEWGRLKSRISAAVGQEAAAQAVRPARPRKRWRSAAVRIGMVGGPLAAAAVIAFAVWGPQTAGPVAPGSFDPAEPMVVVSLHMPEFAGQVSVAFEEEPAGQIEGPDSLPGGTAIAIGPPRHGEPQPIDEALFY